VAPEIESASCSAASLVVAQVTRSVRISEHLINNRRGFARKLSRYSQRGDLDDHWRRYRSLDTLRA
jgi:hypothetical protein